jgi:MFS family permease
MPLGYLHRPPLTGKDPAPPQPFSRSELLVIAACAISMLIVQMDWFALNLAIPAIARQFDVPPTDLQWVISGYMLSIGALMVTAGRLADIFGRRRVIVTGLALFAVLSAICGAAPNETWLIAARVVHGIGAALIFPVSIAVVSGTFTGARQGRAIGVVLGFAAIGTALGPFVGGTFSEYLSWRGVFFVNIPFCLAAIVLMLRYVQESRDETADRHIDVAGMLAITGSLVCISLAFDRGEDWGWTSAATVGTLVLGVALLRLAERFPADRLMAIGMLLSAAGIWGLTSAPSALPSRPACSSSWPGRRGPPPRTSTRSTSSCARAPCSLSSAPPGFCSSAATARRGLRLLAAGRQARALGQAPELRVGRRAGKVLHPAIGGSHEP